jgi:hypothetical protein
MFPFPPCLQAFLCALDIARRVDSNTNIIQHVRIGMHVGVPINVHAHLQTGKAEYEGVDSLISYEASQHALPALYKKTSAVLLTDTCKKLVEFAAMDKKFTRVGKVRGNGKERYKVYVVDQHKKKSRKGGNPGASGQRVKVNERIGTRKGGSQAQEERISARKGSVREKEVNYPTDFFY